MTRLIAACALTLLATGCGGNLTVTNIQTGRALNSDSSISKLATAFQRNDTIYVAVLTDGFGSATLGARFSFQGRVISEPVKKVSYKGAAATEFHIEYSGGFPAGEYDIEVLLNGQSVGTRKVRVDP